MSKDNKLKNIIVTGAAGFIGFHLSKKLLESNHQVIGIDNLNAYYDVKLKEARLSILQMHHNFSFIKADISDRTVMEHIFEDKQGAVVIHLAAQAGVRYSLENPHSYVDSNLIGFVNILEGCRQAGVSHFIYASSSSVYGANNKVPFSDTDNTDKPMNLYAATKKANELLAYSYSHLYAIPSTGLRFFTVYGPWGRPDMAYYSFTKAIIENQTINVFNNGNLERDFTYVDDVVEGIIQLIEKIPDVKNDAPHRIYNIGNNCPVSLKKFIAVLENTIGKAAIKNYLPMQPGDMFQTFANIDSLTNDTGFRPHTTLEAGMKEFVAWYKEYYQG